MHPSDANEVPRVLFYSHDSVGLGHLRRTLTLAHEIAAHVPRADVLIATGSACATHFRTAPGVDLVKLPAATKDRTGAYVPRRMRGSMAALTRLRAAMLERLFETFEPHVFVVDHKVIGLEGELDRVLSRARREGTRTLLGIRDVIDAPEVVAREWGVPRARRALSMDFERVCVYGHPSVFDPRVEYPIPPELAERIEFTGYVVRPAPDVPAAPFPATEPHVLVTVGGGEDGASRLEAYLAMVEEGAPPWRSTLVLGPLLEGPRARRIKRRARALPDVRVHAFYDDLPRLMTEASAVVSMAGYNSVVEILQRRVPAVLLPRTHPRREQLLRARRLAELGLADCLEAAAPAKLRRAIEGALARGRIEGPLPPLDGARVLRRVVCELLPAARNVAESLPS